MTTQTSKAVPGISLTALDAITDPNTREVVRALVDGYHVRNGQSGGGDHRFITAGELGLAKGQSVASLLRAQQAGVAEAPQLRSTDVARIVNELEALVTESPLFKELGTRIALIDAPSGKIGKMKQDLLAAANKMLTEFDAENGQIGDGVTSLTELFDGAIKQTQAIKSTVYAPGGALPLASAAILAINDVSSTSTSANARSLAGLNAVVNDPETGLAASRADYISKIKVVADARNALAEKTELLVSQVNDPTTGLAASRADYLDRINTQASATSAVAENVTALAASLKSTNDAVGVVEGLIYNDRQINLDNATALASQANTVYSALGTKVRVYWQSTAPTVVSAVAGQPFKPATATTAAVPAVAPVPASPQVNDIWYDTSQNNRQKRWNGSSWIDSSDPRIAATETAVSNESNTRSSQDNALATAIQTVWGALGGNSGLIQSGGTITVNPAGAQATAFTQVQSAVKDGNGNIIASAAIKQTTDTLVSKTGEIEQKWVVNMDAGNLAAGFRQAGFGIQGSSTQNGQTYAFGVRADTFWIAGPGESATIGTPSSTKVPFIVRTSAWYDSQGYLQPSGVYMNEAFITTAKIGFAQIDSSHIKTAAVGSLQIAGASVTVGTYDECGAQTIPASNGWINYTTVITRWLDMGDAYNTGVVVSGTVSIYSGSDASFGIRVLVDGAVAGDIRSSLKGSYWDLCPVTGFRAQVPRYTKVELQIYNTEVGPGSNRVLNLGSATMVVMGAKR